MPSTETASTGATFETRSQPWKAHWPPKTEKTPGDSHGFEKGEIMLHGGSSGRAAEYDRHPSNPENLK